MGIFKDKWAKWHIVREAIVTLLVLFFIGSAPSEPSGTLQLLIFITVILWISFPFLMEWIDMHKTLYSDPRAMEWETLRRWIFTDDGTFNGTDVTMGYIGIASGIILYVFFTQVLF